jgi:hypothetical protein
MLKFVKKKILVRIAMNLIGMIGLLGINMLGFYQIKNGWPVSARIAFAVLKSPVRIGGFMLILLPLMLSKSKFLRYFLKIKWLHTLSQLSFGIYIWYPMICLAFYYNYQSMTYVTFLAMA